MFKNIFIGVALLAISAGAQAFTFGVATGSEGGGYEHLGYKVVHQIKSQADKRGVEVDVDVINTNGSLENIDLYNEGDVEAAVVQADALLVSPPSRPYKAKTAHTEVIYYFANIKNGYTDLEDIEGKKDVLLVIVDESGAMVTMSNFVLEDKGYKVNLDTAILADDLYDAFDIVSEGIYEGKKVAGLLHVTKAGKISREMVEDFGAKVAIGELTDGDFDDAKDAMGDKLYKTCEVTRTMRAGFAKATTFSPDTLCMEAKVIYNGDHPDKKMKKVIKRSITKAVR